MNADWQGECFKVDFKPCHTVILLQCCYDNTSSMQTHVYVLLEMTFLDVPGTQKGKLIVCQD